MITINGHRVVELLVSVPNRGVWSAECRLDDDTVLGGSVTILVSGLSLRGVVSSSLSSTFNGVSRVFVVGGAGGWSQRIPRKSYHADTSVRADIVINDIARACGERVVDPPSRTLGRSWIRPASIASTSLESTIGDTLWWVDYEGVTRIGARRGASLARETYQLLDYDLVNHVAVLTADDLSVVRIGSTVVDGLPTSGVIRELEILATADSVRVRAWLSTDETAGSRIEQSLTAIAEQIVSKRIFGKYRYRVYSMADRRVNLQSVSIAEGLPDALSVDMVPGIAGAWAQLTPGAIVFVEFIAGDLRDPIISGFSDISDPKFVPVRLVLGGVDNAQDAARKGDSVRVLLPPAYFIGTVGGQPATGVVSFPGGYSLGTITIGSSKVGIGS